MDCLPRESTGMARMFDIFRKIPIRTVREYNFREYIFFDVNCSVLLA
jgi:hypothetical protein